jgi:HAE1 family hydrophobic/amphiphilic exporter-1
MIAETFIKRPVTAIVISIVLVLVGLISLINLPVASILKFLPHSFHIREFLSALMQKQSSKLQPQQLNSQVNGTPGMTYMTGSSTSSGQSSITVNFEVGTDINIATLDVQNRVTVAEPPLPDAVKRLGITVRKT